MHRVWIKLTILFFLCTCLFVININNNIPAIHAEVVSGFTLYQWASQQGGFSTSQKWIAGDFNGDGKDDLAKVFAENNKASIDIHLSTGTSFVMVRWITQQDGFLTEQKWLVGDYNGDGKDDLAKVFRDNSNTSIDVYLSTGSTFVITRWATQQGWFSSTDHIWVAGDFNGDGKDDLAKALWDNNNASLDVHLSTGSSFIMERWATQQGGFSSADQQWVAGDFNGDGKDDMAKAFWDNHNASLDVHLSSGNSFVMSRWATQQGWFQSSDQRWVAGDFNGDGKDDMAKAFWDNNNASFDVHLSSGNSFVMNRWATQQGGFNSNQKWLAGDFNGDGKCDFAKVNGVNGNSNIFVFLVTPPSVPTNTTVSCDNSLRQITFSWGSVPNCNYYVNYKINGGSWTLEPALLISNSFTKKNLRATDKICFRVLAVNSLNILSSWSMSTNEACLDSLPPSIISRIEAESGVSNGINICKVTVIVPTMTDFAGYKFYRKNSNQDIICLTPNGTQINIFEDTSVSAHGQYEYGYSTYNALGKESAIKWADNATQITPNTIAPKVVIPNITPNANMLVQGPKPIVVFTDVSFTLGPIKDVQNDSLEYRLYTRSPGTTGNGQLHTNWRPTSENQQVSASFPDNTNVEWRITCIESDASVIDRTEVALTEWKPLYINTHYPLPHITSIFNEEGFGTKGQSLDCRIEINPSAHFSQFQWNFGDGSPIMTGQQVTHSYIQLGDFTVEVTATDDQGITYKGYAVVKIQNTTRGQLYANETWSGTHVINGDVIVPSGITLTINSSTQVQVSPGYELRVEGNLITNAGGNIIFDSQDPSGRWKGIRFTGSGAGSLTGASISHATRGIACTGSGLVSINNCTFNFNETGLHAYNGNITLAGCSFLNNTVYGVKEDNGCSPLLTNCQFQGNLIHYYDDALLIIEIDALNTSPNSGNSFI